MFDESPDLNIVTTLASFNSSGRFHDERNCEYEQ